MFNEVLAGREFLSLERVQTALYNRGKAYHSEGQFESALNDFDEALSPSYTELESSTETTGLVYIHRAALLHRLGRIPESQESYDKFKGLASTTSDLTESRGATIYKNLLRWDNETENNSDEDAEPESNARNEFIHANELC